MLLLYLFKDVCVGLRTVCMGLRTVGRLFEPPVSTRADFRYDSLSICLFSHIKTPLAVSTVC